MRCVGLNRVGPWWRGVCPDAPARKMRRRIVRGLAIAICLLLVVLTGLLTSAVILIANPDLWTEQSPVSSTQAAAAGNVTLASYRQATSTSASGDARAVQTSADPPMVVTPAGLRPAGIDPVTTAYAGPWPLASGSTHPFGGEIVGECTGCHESHFSDLAQSGHEGIPCTACHEFPDSPNADLLKAPEPQLCQQCHPDSGYMAHPTTPDHWDFRAGKPLTCTSTCHDPHGSAYSYMLRVGYGSDGKGTDYLCLLCHTQVGIEY